ncbi:MAG: chemotaxis protein CheX [Dehalococcoidia bacterium]|nr:MAG: chemotaxis protein CheX [Dehalococcoidia bacterium]
MKVEYINPFVRAAGEVLERELNCVIEQGTVSLCRSAYTTHDVTVLVGVTGDIQGLVLYGLAEEAACAMAAVILGQDVSELDDLAQSGIAELGNSITAAAGVYLEEAGYHSTMTPPTLLLGKGTMISTIDLPRLVVPITCELGALDIHIALHS